MVSIDKETNFLSPIKLSNDFIADESIHVNRSQRGKNMKSFKGGSNKKNDLYGFMT